ncbi:MAG TPA: hypothetical protein PLW93_04000 [Candidatus Absconditabacterales bacterium]|nr:hypothetical protein [Candidatus Absconditabacterales bacterium]
MKKVVEAKRHNSMGSSYGVFAINKVIKHHIDYKSHNKVDLTGR